jgi:subtilisin family serine protease
MKTALIAWMALVLITGRAQADEATKPTPDSPQILVMVHETSIRHFLPGGHYDTDYALGAAPATSTRTIRAVNRDHDLREIDNWPMPALGVRCYRVALKPGQDVAEAVKRLAADERVESAEPVQQFHTQSHNDAYYPLQTSAKVLKLDRLHQMATGRRIRIALIDSRVEARHPDLDTQLIESVNLVDDSASTQGEAHGTEVAGIMVAKADNQIGIAGVAPAAQLLALRACWPSPTDTSRNICSSFTLAKALQYAIAHQAHIVNMSLAGPPDRLLTRLINKAVDQGIAVVGAVDPSSPDESFPASLPQVIAVSSMGDKVSGHAVMAPGQRVLTTMPPDSWGFVSGSSFAAAHVSGLLALMLEISPKLVPAAMAQLLQQQAHRHTQADGEPWLDACAVIAQLASPCASCHCDDSLFSGR